MSEGPYRKGFTRHADPNHVTADCINPHNETGQYTCYDCRYVWPVLRTMGGRLCPRCNSTEVSAPR